MDYDAVDPCWLKHIRLKALRKQDVYEQAAPSLGVPSLWSSLRLIELGLRSSFGALYARKGKRPIIWRVLMAVCARLIVRLAFLMRAQLTVL